MLDYFSFTFSLYTFFNEFVSISFYFVKEFLPTPDKASTTLDAILPMLLFLTGDYSVNRFSFSESSLYLAAAYPNPLF
jgi:hypothetical protein